VSHVINCAGSEVGNYFEGTGIKYLTFRWSDEDRSHFYESRKETVLSVVRAIDEAKAGLTSVLVHSAKSYTRSSCVLAAFFMYRFHWSLYKTFEYLNWRKPDLEIKSSFFRQLTALEAYYTKAGVVLYSSWDQLNSDPLLAEEEIVIANTFANSAKPKCQLHKPRPADRRQRIVWRDSDPRKSELASVSDKHFTELVYHSRSVPPPSILKGVSRDPERPADRLKSSRRPQSSHQAKGSRERIETKPEPKAELRESTVNTSFRGKRPESSKKASVPRKISTADERERNSLLRLGMPPRESRARRDKDLQRNDVIRQPIKVITPVMR
jgi:hypothetical protein